MPQPTPFRVRGVEGWCDPELLFLSAFAGMDDGHAPVFWLDAGPDAGEGWSLLGAGAVCTDPGEVDATVLGGVAQPDAEATGIPFR
ncbi:MAG: hypothetical protein WA971_09440, partial [Microbacterium sp.]